MHARTSRLEHRPPTHPPHTAPLAAAAGDIVCQLSTGHHVFKPSLLLDAPAATTLPLDAARTAQLAAFQLAMAPVVHEWYALLAARGLGPFACMLLDQGAFAPLGTAAFLLYLAMVSHAPSPALYVAEKIGAILLANYAVWPAIQYANFAYVPLRYRVVVVSVASFFWSAFLSFATH